MIIDATKYEGGKFRAQSASGAVWEAYTAIKAGGKAEFDGYKDGAGSLRDVRHVRATAGQLVQQGHLPNEFTTRYRDGKLIVMRFA